MIELAVRLGELLVACLSVGITLTVLSMKGRERIIKTLTDNHRAAMEAVERQRREADSELEAVRKQVGESLTGIRQQITDMGFFMRDHYVREPQFNLAITSIKDALSATSDKLEARCIRIETEMRNGRKA